MKVLNLDSFTKPKRTITLDGKEFAVVEMSVENFIETQQAAERLKGVDDQTLQVNETVAMVHRFVPSCSVQILLKLPMEALGAILAFVQGNLEVDADGNAILKDEIPVDPVLEGDGGKKE